MITTTINQQVIEVEVLEDKYSIKLKKHKIHTVKPSIKSSNTDLEEIAKCMWSFLNK